METESFKIKSFVSRFFENLKCQVKDDLGKITVEKIPADFEKFCGKKGPYYFSFDKEEGEYELITKGSYLIKAINDYLENRGQTTILRIEFEFDPRKEIEKIAPLMNCKFAQFNKSTTYEYFTRFTFSTYFQYLNEKEQIINSVFVKKKQIFDIDLSKYKTIEAKKRESVILNIDQDYNVAKEKLKEQIKEKTQDVAKNLKESLDKEIERIKAHYHNQIKEIYDEMDKNKKKIEQIEKEKDEAVLSGKNLNAEFDKKIEKIKKDIEKLENSEEKERATREEEFFIKDEMQKHSLNIKNKLINTSVIYFPKFSSNVYLKNDKTARMISFEMNPLTGEKSDIVCDNCKKKVNQIILCSSGHLTCADCGVRCKSCGDIYCEICMKKTCADSGREICDQCAVRCIKCGQWKDKVNFGNLEGRKICRSCMERCSSCGKMCDPDYSKKENGKVICKDCVQKSIKREIFS